MAVVSVSALSKLQTLIAASSVATKVVTVSMATLLGGVAVLMDSGKFPVPPQIFVAKDVVPLVPLPSASPTPAPTAVPARKLPTTTAFGLGVNVTSPAYWSGERSFANLVVGSGWIDPTTGWKDVPDANIDVAGNVIAPPSDHGLNKILTPPAAVWTGTGATIRCTWTGSGIIYAGGAHQKDVRSDHSLEFFWPAGKQPDVRIWIEMWGSTASDPMRNIDCREKDLARSELFAPEFVQSLHPYGVVRFLDWENVNANATLTWATRTPADGINQSAWFGAAIENMIALANQADVDPWFNIPWNADEDYVRRYAQLVHDGIPAYRHVYVEVSNEVWNYSFGAAHQAETEGLAEGLSTNGFGANMARYAEKTSWAMKIWAKVFADRPGQLVRVLASQNDNAYVASTILASGDVAANVDALATAPYFGLDLLTGANATSTDLDGLMGQLATYASTMLSGKTAQNAAVAKQYGKRFVTYEAGQHVITQTAVDMLGRINRDPRMYTIYKNYITDWKTRYNDTLTLYVGTGPVSNFGAFGLREYAGQPIAQAPKLQAVVETGRK